jgi:hypothetical protein
MIDKRIPEWKESAVPDPMHPRWLGQIQVFKSMPALQLLYHHELHAPVTRKEDPGLIGEHQKSQVTK